MRINPDFFVLIIVYNELIVHIEFNFITIKYCCSFGAPITDNNNIMVFEKVKVAQFKDPDGNLLELYERL